MKIDWKKRYDDLKREHAATMKKLAEEFGYLSFVAHDISQMDFGSAKIRCEIHLSRISKVLGREYADYFFSGPEMRIKMSKHRPNEIRPCAAARRHYDALFAIARDALGAIAAFQRATDGAAMKRGAAAIKRIQKRCARLTQSAIYEG